MGLYVELLLMKQNIMKIRYSLATCLLVLALAACRKDDTPEPVVDPLPYPQELETYKDLSVKPGDSFFDYCNGSWLRTQPIPEAAAVGGIYDGQEAMNQRIQELKANVPDIGHYSELGDHLHEHPEAVRAYIDALKARFPRPTTREEAFLTIGQMMMDGMAPWLADMPKWELQWKDGKLFGMLVPPSVLPVPSDVDPEKLIPLTATRADDPSAASLIIRGMGLDASLFVTDPAQEAAWTQFENCSLEELLALYDDVWESYEIFVSQEQMEAAGLPRSYIMLLGRSCLNYTLSYHLVKQFFPPEKKEKFVRITREIQTSLRNRIQAAEWMSETTRSNALEKLDNMGLYVAYPDQWYPECVSSLADCETLVEAIHRNYRNLSRLYGKLLGGHDYFSYALTLHSISDGGAYIHRDLTMVNATYHLYRNSIFIYPAILLPPIMPEEVSEACAYAVYMIIGHELTHGFDSMGSQYDKWGNLHNWWTVADKMAFEERQQNLIQCYNHLEMDPERAPGVYGDGQRTLGENIADLGGFLTALDAYSARLKAEGYAGESYDNQLRKFYEYFAHFWCCQYSESVFDYFKTGDPHSHGRLRVNGVVMNTDLWYRLYNVDRDNYLYLPPERRTYIW